MSEATCKTCPFWDAAPADRGGDVGARECHVRSPVAFTVRCGGLPGEEPSGRERDARWPWTEPDNWCGEHPLSQRDRHAAMAMQGLLAAGSLMAPNADAVAEDAYTIADAMLAAARKEPSRG